MIKILTIFGTRPEAIKLAPVVYEIAKFPDKFESIVGVTGQHETLLKQVLDIFHITPSFNLKVMKPNQSLDELTISIISDFGKILNEIKPDMILVQGDTTTVFAASLTAFYKKIQIGHIEAGMRTGDKYNPFPEEMNRCLTDQLSDLYFAPTEKNRQNLLLEGFSDDKIFITGNTVVDALNHIISSKQHIKPELEKYHEGKMILLTTHRRENFGKPLENIFLAIRQLAEMYQDLQFVFPAHPNPNVLNTAEKMFANLDNFHRIPPVDYLTFVNLMKRSLIILSDSGGVQEEAPSLNKPVLILREKTERPEVVEAGGAILVGTNPEKIILEFNKLMDDQRHYKKMTSIQNPYGNGDAAMKTVKVLIDHFYGVEK
jgi:UDP-N-acetylglucosamine 2-epimerase (non-hydrolysing)